MDYNSRYDGAEIDNLLKKAKDLYNEVDHGTGDTTFALTPNTLHRWGEVSELTLTLAEKTEGIVNEYLAEFVSGETATALTLPDTIKWQNGTAPTIASGKTYQLSIVNDLAVILEF